MGGCGGSVTCSVDLGKTLAIAIHDGVGGFHRVLVGFRVGVKVRDGVGGVGGRVCTQLTGFRQSVQQ